MLFRRRKPQSLIELIRSYLAPKKGYRRVGSYIYMRILRVSATPHAISAGVAAGVFASFTPFLGFHLIIALLISYVIRGNLLVAGLATFVGNPVTIPIIWALNYNIGIMLLDGPNEPVPPLGHPLKNLSKNDDSSSIVNVINNLWAMLTGEFGWTLFIGSIPSGIVIAIAVYFVTSKLVKIYRNSKLHLRRMERKQEGSKAANDDSSANPIE